MVQIVKSQCPMNREFPEVFKTHPTFIYGSNFTASRNLKTKPDMLSCGSCTSEKNVQGQPLQVKGMYRGQILYVQGMYRG